MDSVKTDREKAQDVYQQMLSLPVPENFWELRDSYIKHIAKTPSKVGDLTYQDFPSIFYNQSIKTLNEISNTRTKQGWALRFRRNSYIDSYEIASYLYYILESALERPNILTEVQVAEIKRLIHMHYLKDARERLSENIAKLMFQKSDMGLEHESIQKIMTKANIKEKEIEKGIGKLSWLKQGHIPVMFFVKKAIMN